MRRHLSFVVALFVLAIGCSSSEQPATSPAASDSAPAPATSSEAPAASASAATGAPPEVCAEIKARFEKTLAAASNKCTSDAECGCYPGSLAEGHMCGGVAEVATTDKLREIFREFRVGHCKAPSCASQKCEAHCKQGLCTGK